MINHSTMCCLDLIKVNVWLIRRAAGYDVGAHRARRQHANARLPIRVTMSRMLAAEDGPPVTGFSLSAPPAFQARQEKRTA
jgi:hypothetical protein